jgi:hypothetical protein
LAVGLLLTRSGNDPQVAEARTYNSAKKLLEDGQFDEARDVLARVVTSERLHDRNWPSSWFHLSRAAYLVQDAAAAEHLLTMSGEMTLFHWLQWQEIRKLLLTSVTSGTTETFCMSITSMLHRRNSMK